MRLTADVDDVTGTANDDAFTAGLTVAGTQTLQDFDTIEGGDGTDSLNATLNNAEAGANAVAPTLTDVENVFARSIAQANGNELDLSNATGVEQVWTDRAQSDLTVSNLDSLSTIGAKDVARAANHNYTVRYDANTVAATDTQAFAFDNAVVNLAVEQGAAGTELNTVRNVSIAAEGEANAVTFVSDSNGDTNLVDSANIQNLTITGAGDLTVASNQGGVANTAGTIDASAATGDVELTIADAAGTNLATGVTERTVTMGAGDDTVNAAAADLADSKIDGGEGRDTIVVNGAAANATLVNDLVANVSNFEVLNLNGLAQAVSAATLSNVGFDELVVTDSAANGAINNLTANSNVTLVNTDSAADDIDLVVAGAATNDNAELTVATVGRTGGNSEFQLTVDNVENLTVSTSATDEDDFQATTLTATSANALENLTVTGDEAVVFNGSGVGTLETVDVSGVTASNATDGDLTANIEVANGVTVTGSAGDDSITFAESNEITGGAGEDVFIANMVSATDAGVPRFSTITDLNASEDDSIEFGANGTTLSTATGGTDVNVIAEADLGLAPGANATFADYLNAASDQTVDTVSGFEFAGNTYVVEDNTATVAGPPAAGNEFDATADFIVELTGSVDLSEFTYA